MIISHYIKDIYPIDPFGLLNKGGYREGKYAPQNGIRGHSVLKYSGQINHHSQL